MASWLEAQLELQRNRSSLLRRRMSFWLTATSARSLPCVTDTGNFVTVYYCLCLHAFYTGIREWSAGPANPDLPRKWPLGWRYSTLHGWASTRKVKPIWTLLKQVTVSGRGISWAICKSATLRSRQITMPAPHHSVFYRSDALPVVQPTASKHWRQIQYTTMQEKHL